MTASSAGASNAAASAAADKFFGIAESATGAVSQSRRRDHTTDIRPK